MKPRGAVILAAALLAALAIPLSRAGGQTQVDLSGSWQWSNTSNQTYTYSGPATIQHNVGAGTFTINMSLGGPDSSSSVTGSGTVSGTSINIQTDPYGSSTNSQTYTAQYQGTISDNGTKLQGTWQQSDGQNGTFIATKTSSPSPSTPSPSPTGSADLCIKFVAQTFQGDVFEEYDSCTGELAGDHSILWYKSFPSLISVTNRGPDMASNVKVRVRPSNGSYIYYGIDGPPCRGDGDSQLCSFGNIAPGATSTRDDVRFSGEGTLQERTIELSAAIASSGATDPARDNNEASVTPTLLPGGADLQVRAGGPSSADASSRATYRITFRNDGPDEAKAARLHGEFSFGQGQLRTVRSVSGSRRCDEDSTGFVCEVRRWSTGRSGEVTITVVVTIPGISHGKKVKLEAWVRSDTPDPVRSNSTDVVVTSIRDR